VLTILYFKLQEILLAMALLFVTFDGIYSLQNNGVDMYDKMLSCLGAGMDTVRGDTLGVDADLTMVSKTFEAVSLNDHLRSAGCSGDELLAIKQFEDLLKEVQFVFHKTTKLLSCQNFSPLYYLCGELLKSLKPASVGHKGLIPHQESATHVLSSVLHINGRIGLMVLTHATQCMTHGEFQFQFGKSRFTNMKIERFILSLLSPSFSSHISNVRLSDEKSANVLKTIKQTYKNNKNFKTYKKNINNVLYSGVFGTVISICLLKFGIDLSLPGVHRSLFSSFDFFKKSELHSFVQEAFYKDKAHLNPVTFLSFMSFPDVRSDDDIDNALYFASVNHFFSEDIHAQAGWDFFGVNDTLTPLAEKLGSFIDSIQERTENVESVLNSVFYKYGPKFLLIAVLSFVAYGLMRMYVAGDNSLLVQITMVLGITTFVMPTEISSLISEILSSAEGPKAESGFSWEPIVKLSTMVIGFISGMNLKTFTFRPKDVISSIGSLPKLESGLKYMFDAFLNILTECVNFVRTKVFKMHPILNDHSHIEEVDKFIKRATAVVVASYDVKPPLLSKDYNEIIRLQQMATVLYAKKYGDNSKTAEVLKMISKYMSLLERCRKPYDSTSLRADFIRCEPLVVLLRGSPGQGKSLAGSLLARILTSSLLDVDSQQVTDNINDYIFSRNPENVYWEGYNGQFCTFMDDFGQCKDIAGNPDNEYLSLIRLGNSFPAPLHMASLETKANTFFSSELILATSNQENFKHVQSIHFTDALHRRFDVVVDIRVNPEKDNLGNYLYARDTPTGVMLDSDKWCKEAILVDLYSGMDASSKGKHISTMSYTQFIDYCKTAYKKKRASFEHITSANDDIIMETVTSLESCPSIIMSEESFSDSEDVPINFDFKRDETKPVLFEILRAKYSKLTKNSYNNFINYVYSPVHSFSDRLCHMISSKYHLADLLVVEIFEDIRNNHDERFTRIISGYYNNAIRKHIDSLMNSFSGWYKSTRLYITEYINQLQGKFPVLEVGALISGFVAVATLFRYLFTPANVAQSEHPRGKGNVNPKAVVHKYVRTSDGHIEPTAHSNLMEIHPIANKVVNKNTILIRKSGDSAIWARATVIRGSIAVIPHHYFFIASTMMSSGEWDPTEDIDFYTSKGVLIKQSCLQEFVSMERHDVPHYDLSFFVIPGRLKTFPDITKHFIRLDDLPHEFLDCMLVVTRENGAHDIHKFESTVLNKKLIYSTQSGEKVYTDRHMAYPAKTTYGDCGSIIYAEHTNYYPNPIIGFHVAGASTLVSDRGYSTVITREIVLEAIKHFDPIEACSPDIDAHTFKVPTTVDFVFDDFRVAATTNLPLGHVSKSRLTKVKSIYGSLGECHIAPALLSPYSDENGVVVDPFITRLKTYTKHSAYLPEPILDDVADHLSETIINKSKPFKYRALTFEEAVAGIPGNKFMNGLPRGTSSGYPYCKLKPPSFKGKKHFFGTDGDYEFHSVEALNLKSEVDKILTDASHGVRGLHVYGDFLKDETRPLDKITKPRLISCAPIAYTIAVRMKFLSIVSWLMENRIVNGISVGVNPYSEWSDVAFYLQNDTAECLIAGDFKGFDTTINSSFWRPVHRFFINVLKSDPTYPGDVDLDSRIMAILLLDVFSSVHIRDQKIYYWNSGMPSGNPLTTIVNCLVNSMVIRFAWIIAHDRRSSSLSTFNDNVKILVYGDDNIISVHSRSHDVFSPVTMPLYMSEAGFEYTSEIKDKRITHFRTIYQISFLKREFRWSSENGVMLCPLDIEVVRQMCYYVTKSKDFKSTVISTYESFLHELSLHDETIWDEYYAVISRLMEENFSYHTQVSDFRLRVSDTLKLERVY